LTPHIPTSGWRVHPPTEIRVIWRSTFRWRRFPGSCTVFCVFCSWQPFGSTIAQTAEVGHDRANHLALPYHRETRRGRHGCGYKAEDTKLRRTVALKFLRGDFIESSKSKERFLREAQAAAGLDHPNICTVHEIDEAGGKTFLAMALVEGQSVKDKIAARPLKLDEALGPYR
jgi:hypothetical protein